MKKQFLYLLLLCVSVTFAQNNNSAIITDSNGSNSSGGVDLQSGFWIKESKPNNLDGTYYLHTNWINRAEVFDLDGKGYKVPNCNFNIKFNRIEALMKSGNDGKVFAFNSRDLSKFKLGKKLFVKKNTDQGANQLVEVIQTGDKASLYKLYDTTIKTSNINPMTQQKMGNDKIEINATYYVERDGKMEMIKLKKSTLLKIMASHKDEMKKFIKENKLSFSEDAHLSKMFSHYNAL